MALFPKKVDFFEILDKALDNLSKATNLLVDTFNNPDNFEKKAKAIYEFEQDGDMFTHDIMKELNKTFLTPIDREDIHALAARIDDVLDFIWAAVDRMVVYKIDKPTTEAISIAEDLQMTADILKKAMGSEEHTSELQSPTNLVCR